MSGTHGVVGHGSRFSLSCTTEHALCVRLTVHTDREVELPSVTYGGVPMAHIPRFRWFKTTYDFEIYHPPAGVQAIIGVFSKDVNYKVQLIIPESIGDVAHGGRSS